MELIIGGAYQGKEQYAAVELGISHIESCGREAAEIDFSRPAIAHIENFVLSCIRANVSAVAFFEKNRGAWEHCVFLADDISAGVVPMDPEMRAWREETGRLLAYLAGEAKRVHRVFCGIGQVIK